MKGKKFKLYSIHIFQQVMARLRSTVLFSLLFILTILLCQAYTQVISGNVCSIQREDAEAGLNYAHTCVVDKPENNNSTIIIVYMTLWKKNDISLEDIHSDILLFSPLIISDAGYYSCEVEISTMDSTETFDNDTWLLQVKVPIVSVNVTSDPPSSTGLFCCEVPDVMDSNQTICVNIVRISLIITPIGDNTAGEQYSLKCTLRGYNVDTMENVTFQWILSGSEECTSTKANSFASQLTFDPLQSSHEGNVTCQATVGNISVTESYLVTVNDPLPPPNNLSATPMSSYIIIMWDQPFGADEVQNYTIKYNFTVKNCNHTSEQYTIMIDGKLRMYNITNNSDHAVEEDSMYNISLTATNSIGSSAEVRNNMLITTTTAAPSGPPQDLRVISTTLSNITIEWNEIDCVKRNGPISGYNVTYIEDENQLDEVTISDHTYTAVNLQPNRSYEFKVQGFLNGTDEPSPPATLDASTIVSQEVGLLLRSHLYGNNSIVNLNDIGEKRNSLFCLTNETTCCSNRETSDGALGNWYFPDNGSAVKTKEENQQGFYKNRGPSVIRLQRTSGTTSPSGLFHCIIPDNDGINHTIYVGVYPLEIGTPSIQSLEVDKDNITITCISTGGPATTVTWMKNGEDICDTIFQKSQRVLDTGRATYENLLSSNDIENIVGSLTCKVCNVRGCDSMNTSNSGVIIEHDTVYFVGTVASVWCISDVPTNRIEWFNDNQTVLASAENNQRNLNLTFNPVSDTDQGRRYTCKVNHTHNEELISLNFTLKIQVLPNVLNASITYEGSTTAGENHTITCTIEKLVNGLHHTPTASWITKGESLDGLEVHGEKSSRSVLTFNPLRTSHAGNYTCQGNLTSFAFPWQHSISTDYQVVVQISSPDITLTIPNTTLYAGTNVSVTCNITVSNEVDNNVSANVIWFRGSVQLPNDMSRAAIPQKFGNTQMFTSTLILAPLSDKHNGISYTCEAWLYSQNPLVKDSVVNKMNISIPVSVRGPSAPSDVMLHSKTSTSISVRWSQRSDDFIKGFNISATYTGPCTDFNNISRKTFLEPTMREFNITKLQEFSNYSITITAFNGAGSGSTNINTTTEPSAPGGPNSINITAVNLTSVTITWEPLNCIHQNSKIEHYTVYYGRKTKIDTKLGNMSINMFVTKATIRKLDPNTEYVFSVEAVSVNRLTGPEQRITVNTSVPKGVGFLLGDQHYHNNSIVSLSVIGENTSALSCLTNSFTCCQSDTGNWYDPILNQAISNSANSSSYITRGPSSVRLNQRKNTTSPSGVYHCSIPDADGLLQTIYIGVYSDRSGVGAVIAKELTFDKLHQALSCVSTGGPPTTLHWLKDEHILDVTGATYSQSQLIINASSSTYKTTLFVHPVDQVEHEVVGNYTCIVNNSRVISNNIMDQVRTLEIQGIRITGHEYPLKYGSLTSLNCTTDLAVDSIEWLNMNGSVLVNGSDLLLSLDVRVETNNLRYTCRVKSKFGTQTKAVTLMPIPEATLVVSNAVSAVIIAVVLTLLFVTAAISVSVVITRRKCSGKRTPFSEDVKRKPCTSLVVHVTPLHAGQKDTGDEEIEMFDEKLVMKTFGKSDSKKNQFTDYKGDIVSFLNFGKHVKRMHKDRDKLFETEYESISKHPQKPHAAADIVENRLRNRFANIFPYDHCRVKLKELVGSGNSDYINASYIDGYQKPYAYIAAQGPLPNTLEDFWRMIWEKRLPTIVMLTQCFEGRKKCECYWPENISNTFEPGQRIKVVLTSVTPFAEYNIRRMTVTKISEPEMPALDVTQLHFVAWPDHGVPDNCAVMVNFIRRVRRVHPYSNPNTLLVHCSAGVGRTGTFIVLDSMLERMETNDTLNVYDFVRQLREQRVLMVQTLAQYIFIHDALNEVILCGQTEIPAVDIKNIISQLSMQHDPCSASTGFEHQFQVLHQLQHVTKADCFSNATSDQNKGKNRYYNKLPNNYYRVRLKSTATPDSDYINASFIDGYRQRNAYIATQGPLGSTVCDFWRMVWEKESKCVVFLSKLMEQGQEMCCCYWPTTVGETANYGHMTVKLLVEERYGEYDLRKFEIDESKSSHPGVTGVKTAFNVSIFHFLVWPEYETPPITSSLIELIGNVNKVQMGSRNQPIIVMCNDGMGRTGTFICIHAQLERLKTEGVVDFFQFIKSARMKRPGIVADSTQYVLCHNVLSDYVDSFETYANFKDVI